MNILMLNPVHPTTAHISAVRAWRFAQELATLGHRVVLLAATASHGETSHGVPADHDWRQPLVLPCAAATPSDTSSRLPVPLRRARTALRMLIRGGEASTWVNAAVATGCGLPRQCTPDVVWCTFGRMESVFAARRIARRLRRPWVLDVKDNWELYVPHGLRRLMVWRTRGFATATANARLTRHMTHKWQGAEASLIYSGVENCFLAPADVPSPANFEINLIGGIYFPEFLRTFLTGVAAWYQQLPIQQRTRVRLRHIGEQGELVRKSAHELIPSLAVELPGYVPVAEMAQMCQRACVNAYITHSGTFHHKLLELLACGRPVLACPSENEESIALAAPSAGQLIVAATAEHVARTLGNLSTTFFRCGTLPDPYPGTHLRDYTWPAQTRLLQRVLSTVASGTAPPSSRDSHD